MASKDWSASTELNRMKTAGITLPKNPIAGRVAARDMLDRAKTSGSMLNEIGPMATALGGPPEGRQRLNNLKQGFNLEGVANTPNRRLAAATGSDAQWALPKLHDPFEYWRERCVLPGEEITLLDGPKKIEDVTYGDRALTHMGRYRRVLDLGNQEYEGKVYQLKPRYRTAINVTADHPIWTLREDGGQFIHVQDLKPNDKILFPVDRRIEDKEFINLTEIIDHSDLVIENGYFTRKLSEKYGAAPKRLRGKPGRPINSLPVEIELTDDFLWFLGLYIAEGSTGGPDNKTIHIALSTKETDLINRTVNVLEKLTGKVADIRDHTKYGDNSVIVELANLPLSRALPILCGKGSYNKHFPEWAQFLPEEKQKALLRGYFDGDGCYQPDISSCFTSSNHLRDQILQMMARNGFFPSVYHRTTKSFSKKIDGKNIVLSRTENSAFLNWMDIHIFDEIDDDVIVKRGRKYPIEHVAEGVWIPVEEVIESDYKGTIYSLTITEDHSYCVSGIATRNTWWFNMEDPDEQTRKIRDWARLLYSTHHLVPSLIDIYTRFPLLDIELVHPDKRIADFYNELFFDSLDYQEFLFDLGREHWTVGEVFAMGSWHDGIGAWEEDEIINPNDVIVAKNRALRTYQYHVKVPEEIKRLIERRDPPQEYAMLMQLYPDVVAWARQDKEIPVSDVIMKQIKFKCVVGSTDIMTPTGPVQARDLAVGDEVLAWDETTNKIVRSTVSHQGINEPEPIYWITTKQGRKIGVNSEHPFLTDNGWVEAADLSIGTNLLVGHSYNPEMISNVSTDEARFFGLMVGDGSYGHKTIMFHNEDKEILNWMNEFVAGYSCKLSQAGDREISFVISQGEQTKNPNLIKKLIVDAGIKGQTTYTKRVPSCIWDGGPEVWGAFLAGYLDTDGHVDSNGMVVWTSMNRSLLEDCQTLLSFLGVESRIYDVPKYDYAPDSGYGHRLIVGKQEAKSLLSHYVQPLCSRKQVPNTTPIRNTRPSKFPYDQIVKIEMGIDEETMAIGIDEHHTHITAGLVTHNTNPWSEHGTPILLRAFRMLMLEESLNAAQDAIADRLYSPLILATLGLPDVDQDGPWIPDAMELQSLRDDLSMAINSDFRLMTYHHGLQIQNAFGRESMPRLDQDFLRVQTNVMGVFGIGSDLIQGGQGGTYASGALNRELITQMLSTYQHKIEKFIRSRMEPVAERQGHYEMRNVGGQMVPVMETVLMVDEETGAEYVEERPKLAIPEVRFRSMNLRDETVERGFLQQLSAAGFPISLSTLAVNIPIDFDDEVSARKEEKIKTVVAEQQFKKELFDRLYTLQLPIPPEYVQEYQAYLAMLEDPSLGAQLAPGAMAGLVTPPSAPNMTGNTAGNSDAAAGAQVYPSINQEAQQRQRPEESYEQRKNQPKPSKKGPKNGPKKKTASVSGWDEDDEFDEFTGRVEYGDRMKFAVPFEQKKRKRMKLASGMKIIVDDSYEKFDEDQFKQNLASLIDDPMITEPTDLNEHSSGEGGMDQPARKQIDPTVEEPFPANDL